MHVLDVLKDVDELGRVAAANGQANNAHEIELVAIVSPSTSATPLITPSRGWHATASPSTSAVRGRGWCATTPWVVTSPEIPLPILHASPQPEVPPPISDASP